MAISCRLAPASIKKLCHCEPVRTLAWQSVLPIPLSLRGSESRGNLLSVGSCVYQKNYVIASHEVAWQSPVGFFPLLPTTSVIARLEEPWQSVPPIPLSLRGSKSRGNLLSVGSCVYRNSMSLRASAHTGVAIRNPCHCEGKRSDRGIRPPYPPVIARLEEPWQSPVGWFLRLSKNNVIASQCAHWLAMTVGNL